MELDLRRLLRMGRRWWWLLLLAPAIAGFTAHYKSAQQPPLYSATATLQVNPAPGAGRIDWSAIQGSQSLAETYRRMITLRSVLDKAAHELGLPPGGVGGVSASTVTNTYLLLVSVSNTDPDLAAKIANAVARSFQAYTVEQAARLGGPTRKALDDQIAATRKQIATLDDQIRQLETGPTASDPATQAQITSLRDTQSQQQTSLNQMVLSANQLDLNAAAMQTQVTIAQEAVAPGAPYAPLVQRSTELGVIAGLFLACAAIFLFEYLDNTVKAGADFTSLAGGPLLAAIGTVPKLHVGHDQLFLATHPKTTAAEAVRLLRTNIEFAAATREITTLAISSPGPGEGKSTLTANLGLAMAQAGFKVVIVDADLRRPSQHRIFAARNDQGLTTLLTHPQQPWTWAAIDVAPNLTLIPSGPLPPNPADLLSLDRLGNLLTEVSQDVDIILLDTPPILAVSDPLVVASKVDGLILTCRAGHTRTDTLRRAAASLHQVGVRVVGVVLNRESGRGEEGYYYTQRYDTDESPKSGPATTDRRQRARNARNARPALPEERGPAASN